MKREKKTTTLKDIAIAAGVSITTVSKVLAGDTQKIGEITRQKVLQIAHEMHYEPNIIARSLVSNKSSIIGLLLPNITNPYFADIATSVISKGESHGYQVMLCTTTEQAEKESSYITTLKSYAVAGFIIAPECAENNDIVDRLEAFELPYVLIDNYKEIPFNNIYVDDFTGAYIAAQYLIDNGHRKIAYIGGESMRDNQYQKRYDGFIEAMCSYGIPIRQNLIHFGSYILDTGYTCAEKLLEQKEEFTAIVCGNDMIAAGAMQALQNNGLRIPDDVSLVGYDDTYLACIVRPSLTTVKQPASLIGNEAVELLLKQINGRCRHVPTKSFSPTLVIRNSVRPVQ